MATRTTELTNLACFPDALLSEPRWVVWKYVRRRGQGTKVPFQVANPRLEASSTNPETWRTFAEARTCYDHYGWLQGLGYVLGDGIFGIDLDHCVENSTILPAVQQIIDRFQTYAEISPSGTGVHVIGRGKLPGPGHKQTGVECYDIGRYFTVTMQPCTTYTLRDCQDILTAWYTQTFGERTPTSLATVAAGWMALHVTFTPTAEPPASKLLDLLTTKKARQTWECQRTDLHDVSLSGHQASLACFALHAGWQAQEICDLLIAHRRTHSPDLKRLDYYQRTIWSAQRTIGREEAQESLQQPGSSEVLTPEEIRTNLAQIFGCRIVRITREGVENAVYSVQLNGHLIPIGGAREFRNQDVWKDLLVNHRLRPFDRMKEVLWNNTLGAVLQLVEHHENEDTSWESWLKAALVRYVGQEHRARDFHTLTFNQPFVDEGVVIGIHLDHFRQWAQLRYPDAHNLSRGAAMAVLRHIGFVPKQLSERENTVVIGRRYWLGELTLLEDGLSHFTEDTSL